MATPKVWLWDGELQSSSSAALRVSAGVRIPQGFRLRLRIIDSKYGSLIWALTLFFFVCVGLQVWALICIGCIVGMPRATRATIEARDSNSMEPRGSKYLIFKDSIKGMVFGTRVLKYANIRPPF